MRRAPDFLGGSPPAEEPGFRSARLAAFCARGAFILQKNGYRLWYRN